MRILRLFESAQKSKESYVRYDSIARLYEFKDKLYVCSVAGISETDSLTILDVRADDESVGQAVLKHLAECQQHDERDLHRNKASDWTAFRLSGANSIKSFERLLWHVDLAIMNSAVLIAARPRLSLHKELSATAQTSRYRTSDVGHAVRKAIAAAKVLREQGIF